ncbi:MAG TPA: methyltransferase domain-containing protein [Nitrososphaerales archaeon]|nr:methyltransferase domain-containing protein [Nitrososphaerales archaeon]
MEYLQTLNDTNELYESRATTEKIGVEISEMERAWAVANLVSSVKSMSIDFASKMIDFEARPYPATIALHKLGMKNLYVVDANRNIYDYPHYTKIRYQYARTAHSHFPPAFFDWAVCLDTFRTGVDLESVLENIARILKPMGVLQIATRFCPITGKDSRAQDGPLSSPELVGLIETARKKGLDPLFDDTEIEKIKNPPSLPLKSRRTDYTLAFLTFKKKNKVEGEGLIKSISILSYTNKRGGISEYISALSERLTDERGFDVDVVNEPETAKSKIVLIEFESGLERSRGLVNDVDYLLKQGKKVIIEIHDCLTRSESFDFDTVRNLQEKAILTYRANEIAELDGAEKYFLYPHISYLNLPEQPFAQFDDICLGSFGFGTTSKRFDEIVAFAKKVNARARILISINQEYGLKECIRVVNNLKKDRQIVVYDDPKNSSINRSDRIVVRSGFFTTEEILGELKNCSHILFAQKSHYWTSGTMTFAKRLSRPIVAIDSFQAKQAQVIRVSTFSRVRDLSRILREITSAARRRKSLNLRRKLTELKSSFGGRPLSYQMLKECSGELSRDEDGLEYLYKIIEHANSGSNDD